MFVFVWSQVQHGSGLINHMMIAIWSIGSQLISVLPVDPIIGYQDPLDIIPVQQSYLPFGECMAPTAWVQATVGIFSPSCSRFCNQFRPLFPPSILPRRITIHGNYLMLSRRIVYSIYYNSTLLLPVGERGRLLTLLLGANCCGRE